MEKVIIVMIDDDDYFPPPKWSERGSTGLIGL
jgi:hypothetical protein